MSIGNAINSLPIAYAPLNGTGRKVAYALSYQTVESTIGALPSVISHAVLEMGGSVEGSFKPLRVTDCRIDASAGAVVSSAISPIIGGFAVAEASGEVSPVFTAIKISAFSVVILSGEVSPVPLRVVMPHCDFRSLYTPPGESISGNAINSFALGASAINTSVGGVWRTFVSICNPQGNALFAPNAEPAAQSLSTPQGNVFFAPGTSSGAFASSAPVVNVVFVPFTDIEIDGGVNPFSMAYRAAGGSLAQDISESSGFGVVIHGGKASPAILLSADPQCSILAELYTAQGAEGGVSPTGQHIVAGFAANEAASDTFVQALRAKVSFADVQAVADISGVPWDPVIIVISTLYAQNWDATAGINIVQNIVDQVVSPGSIVYRVAPESIVYGQIS